MASPNAGDLRRLAEAVDGMRDLDLQVVTDGSGGLTYRTAIQPGDTLLFTVRTNNGQQRPTAVATIYSNGGVIGLDGCDSVFWTEAAVEKFVWPYYEAHGIDVSNIRTAYQSNPNIVGIAHKIPTNLALLVAGASGVQLLTWEQYSQP